MKNKRTPDIRFAEFTGDWEQRKLGDVADIVGGGTPSTSSEEYWNGNIDWYSPVEIGEKTYVSSSQKKITELGLKKSSAKILPVGTILFTSRAGIGSTAILAKEGATNQGFQSIVPHKEMLDSYFIYSRSHELKRYGELTGAGSTFVEVSGKQMAKMPILMPTLEEQRIIGKLFENMDNLITLHQQELTTLKQTKQGFLQKMFPKKGESVPEVRFPGFTEEWEQRKLNEVAEIIGGGTPSTDVPEYWDGDIDWYSPVEIGKETYAFGSQRKITALGLRKSSAKVLPANKTILFTSRAGIGDMAILKKDGATNQGFQSLVVNNNYDIYFVYSIGYKIKEFALKHASGSTFLEISGKGLGKMNLSVPSLEEQTKIGNFFEQLDNTIALHQCELDTLKETKKAFLQKMFA
ncbi:restriction endonuclease subunit S [Bacillus mycoides]|uniref:Restriction endonuclease subunit S n=1 Tax=Bacillus thuringiensis serovar navarrensis TaxID=339658 RepID=A0A243AEC7_BACTU|nr:MULTISPECIES: restriction endonuclease subunit S [Bacillus cereus group]MED1267040.1 restriction endonuclease subunit S [Bacillus mycoides]OTY18470.1 restriction endonuclease subunit S [Bacillus thuringiensis serovar navarrensis]